VVDPWNSSESSPTTLTGPVSSHNEWDTLEEVIVGTPFHLDYHNDRSFRIFFHLNRSTIARSGDLTGGIDNSRPSEQMKEECLEDLDGLIKILTDFGVTVRRPDVLDHVPTVQSPFWRAPMGHALMSRDLFLVIGDEIIETAPMMRARYFEPDLYKELFTEYFRRGARWTVAPKSRLLDRNFDTEYLQSHGFREEEADGPFPEIMFDAAQVIRLGRDLVFNVSSENHRLGAEWLRRHLGDTYRIHEVEITDTHIDGEALPLRPGVLLVHDTVDVAKLPEKLQKWKMIRYSWLGHSIESPVDDGEVPLLASQSIGMNVLSLDPEHVLVQDIQEPLIRDLERNGFTPVPCRWRHGRSLGGGFHCATLDVRRSGGLEDYF
jgi:glycine amidinotransferase